MGKVLFEAPVYTLEAALDAAGYGVDRLELCADFAEGGTTPSSGLLTVIKKRVNLPVFAMIRPRGGDFIYSDGELDIMMEDIRILKACGADGFVFGVLKENGEVNEEACKLLIETAHGKPCTFHRAFDIVPEKEAALESIIDCGFKRILTSGGRDTVGEGIETISGIMMKAGDRIIVIPGGGTKAEHLPLLYQNGYLKEFHASCKRYRRSRSTIKNDHLQLSLLSETDGKILSIDPEKVRVFRQVISQLI